MFKEIQTKILAVLNEQKDLQERRTRMILAFACLASLIGMGRVMLGADPLVLIPLVLMCITSAAAFWITFKYHKIKAASWFLVITTNCFLLPAVYLLSGGTESGTPIWFVLGLVYVYLLFRGRNFVAALVLSSAAFALAYAVSYCFPQVLSQAPTRFYSIFDSFNTMFAVSCFIGLLLKAQVSSYERESRLVEQQKEEIERIARSKDAFFANMSHEIRTPINTIIGLNEMTLREDISDEIAENAINIQNASKMLLTTINDILDLSKLESGKMEIVQTQYELSSMLSDLVNLIWVRAYQKELEFKVDIDRDLPSMLCGDEVRIKQIVGNMLTNAVKYTEKGSVTLTAKGERLSSDAILLRISVADTGTGIRKENLDDLFSSFKRVDEKANCKIEGTGLGLAISKQLVEMMGGKISVDSVYHKGSVFTIELKQGIVSIQPVGIINFAAQKQLNRRTRYKQRFAAPEARILVVDDNDMNRMVAVKLLRSTKVQVETADSGRECLRKTAEKPYHVILMDHMMPGMDGEETLKAVRSQAKGFCQKVPVLALTANVMSNAEQLYRDMGFDGYLAKPVNAALLEAGLLKYLPQELVQYTAGEADADGDDPGRISQITSARKRKAAVTADCICDLPEEWLDKLQIRLMYCYVHTKEGRFCDLSEVSSDSLLNYLKTEGNEAHSSTAEPSEYEYFFADTLEKAEQVLHITASASLSGAYPNASQAAKNFDNVTVVDSGHISSGYGLMVTHAAVMAEAGKSVEEICRALEQFRNRVCSDFYVPSTDTLFRNGKVGGGVHKLCRTLGLHPVLHMSGNKLKLWMIEMGRLPQSRRRYVRKLFRAGKGVDTDVLFLTYAGCTVRELDEILEEVKKYAVFDRVILQKASATVSCNCGVGTFGLMFVQKAGRGM